MATNIERYRPVLSQVAQNGAMFSPPPIVEMANSGNVCGLDAQPALMLDARSGMVGIPGDVAQWLCWNFRGMRALPKTGQTTGVQLVTNPVTLPSLGSFQVSPDGPPQLSMGRIFPYEWESEMVGLGIYRIKVDWIARVINGPLQVADVVSAAQNLEFRILKLGTEDRHIVALNIGDAQDASKSVLSPADGGFWLPEGSEWIPWKPSTQAFDFAGLMPGAVGVDAYELRAVIRVYTRQIRCY